MVHPERYSRNNDLEFHSRHLGQYETSASHLRKALDEKSHLEDVEVADVLKELSAMVSSSGEYTQSRLGLLYIQYYSRNLTDENICSHFRKQLEEALHLYETVHKPKCGSGYPVVAEALSSLAYLCFKLGEWDQGKVYLDRTREELMANSQEGIQVDPSVSISANLGIKVS